MGNPIFRFRLIHDIAGIYEITEPEGWKDARLLLERDENFHSLIEKFDSPFLFYGNNGFEDGGVDFIRYIEKTYGFDADLTVDIDVSFNSGISYEDIFTGLYDFTLTEEINLNKIKSGIIRNDLWSKFVSRLETPINLQSPTGLDGDPVDVIDPINIILPSQTINKTTSYTGQMGGTDDDITYALDFVQSLGANGASDDYTAYIQGNVDLDQDEIPDSFNTVAGFVVAVIDVPTAVEIADENGEVTISLNSAKINMDMFSSYFMESVEPDPTTLTSISIVARFFVQKNNDTPILLGLGSGATHSGFGVPGDTGISHDFNISFTEMVFTPASLIVNVLPVDTLKVFIQWDFVFNLAIGADDPIKWSFRRFNYFNFESDITYVFKSQFPNSTSQGFLVHDAGRLITDRIISENNKFSSELLGGAYTSPSYESEGCGYRNFLLKGLHIRKYNLAQKPFFISFMEWWNGINPILNLGLSYETIDGEEVIQIEKKEDFYSDEVSINFDEVFDIVRTYDESVIYKKAIVGYSRWESESISGIDDPQSIHTYATRLKKTGSDLTIKSEFMAASLAIEETRRQSLKKSKDYRLDNETFILALNESNTSPDGFTPELDENFSSITNLLNPETRYNSRLTPARNFLRWLNVINGCLQTYLDSVYKFVQGEGNYDMTSDLIDSTPNCDEYQTPISEKQDIQVTDNYLHLADLLTMNIKMSWDDYKTVRDNRKKSIGISQTDANHTKFKIKSLSYRLADSKATIIAWPKTPFYITNTDFIPPVAFCQVDEIGCEDAYLTEDNFELITEDGDCLILE